jgi:hypothetical protein
MAAATSRIVRPTLAAAIARDSTGRPFAVRYALDWDVVLSDRRRASIESASATAAEAFIRTRPRVKKSMTKNVELP